MKTSVGCCCHSTDNMNINTKYQWQVEVEGAVATAPYECINQLNVAKGKQP